MSTVFLMKLKMLVASKVISSSVQLRVHYTKEYPSPKSESSSLTICKFNKPMVEQSIIADLYLVVLVEWRASLPHRTSIFSMFCSTVSPTAHQKLSPLASIPILCLQALNAFLFVCLCLSPGVLPLVVFKIMCGCDCQIKQSA